MTKGQRVIESLYRLLGLRKSKNSSTNGMNEKPDLRPRVNITYGFKINKPDIFVPWNIDEKTLTNLFEKYEIKHITTGYYTAQCCSLENLNCMIGFNFNTTNQRLNELEFFRMKYDDQKKSFDEFQSSFEKEFGQPTSYSMGIEGYNNYLWRIGDIQIIHYIFDRFGLEEHMRIKRQ